MFLLIIYAQHYAQNSTFLVIKWDKLLLRFVRRKQLTKFDFYNNKSNKNRSAAACVLEGFVQSVYVLKSYYFRRIYWAKELTNAALKVTLNGYFKSITQKAFTAKIQMMDVNAPFCQWMTNCVVSLLLQWEIISGSVNFCAAASLLLYNIIIIIIVIAIISHTIAFPTQLY